VSTPASEPWISGRRAPGHALDPPDISVIQDICEIEGHAFAAMELLLGQTFRHRIEGRRFKLGWLFSLAIQIPNLFRKPSRHGLW
jgi:hypothetical protein